MSCRAIGRNRPRATIEAAIVPLLLFAGACGPEIHELNRALREGRPYVPRYEHPCFPADSTRSDSLTAGLQLAWNDLEALMKPAELAALQEVADLVGLAAWRNEFWRRRDPLPTTERNEREEDHRERLVLARSLYASPRPPHYDARGRALIRFGQPERVLAAEAEVTGNSYEPPVEVWRVDDMILGFQSFANSGVFMPAGMPRARESLFYALAGSVKEALVMLENYEIADEAGAERYVHELEGAPLWVAVSLDFFRADPGEVEGASLLRVYYQLRGDELAARADSAGGEVRKLQQALALVDPVTRERVVRREEQAVKASARDEGQLALLSGLIEQTVAPGSYDLTFHLRDAWGEGEQIVSRKVVAPRFRPDSLALSDISLFRADGYPDPVDPWEQLLGFPHPVASYRRGMKLAFYYEVYGLRTGRRGRAEYMLRYSIEGEGQGKRGMSSIFYGRSEGNTAASSLVIDTSQLVPGDYKLSVTVTDESCRLWAIIPERCRVERSRKFRIVAASADELGQR